MKKAFVLFIAAILVQYNLYSQSCGTTNIALTKEVTASSHLDDYSTPANIVDGSIYTNWKSGSSTSQWIKIDLGQTYSICNIELAWSDAFTYPTSYTVELSATGEAGTGTYVYNTSSGDGALDEINLGSPVTGRYLRIQVTARAAAWADKYELMEARVFTGTGNPPPSVAITSPASNATFIANSNITINADASDDETVSKVEFFHGTTKLGEDLSAPFTFTWNTVGAGSYVLTAKATDNDNAITTSAEVNITVSASSATGSWLLAGNGGTTPGTDFLGTTDNKDMIMKTNGSERVRITADGKLLINTTSAPGATAHLAVNGEIWAKKLKITQASWADFVFDSSYRLMPLDRVAAFIAKHKHLPDVPSEKEVLQDGISVGDNQAVLLRKIEELTLYLIEQDKKIKQLQAEMDALKKKPS
jgi:hypothetical protein